MLTGAIYICTEGVFPSRRLQQLIQNSEIAKNHPVNGDVIFVDHASTIVITFSLSSTLFDYIKIFKRE